MIRLLLVRHGETDWNGAGRLQGRLDVALSERGRAQARALQPALATFTPSFVVTSALRRTAETAEELATSPDRADHRLDEAHLGRWEGEYSARLQDAAPEEYTAWRAGLLRPPGGESFEELTERVVEGISDAVQEAASGGHRSLLVVTHGGPVRALLRRAVGLDPALTVPAHPASLSVLEVDHTRPLTERGACRLRLFNHAPSAPDAEPAD